ncbi:GNAT family N-acetyltransferase [Nonomuraea sp. PA05]|uniref:GNAT family N-acetyltransferase n=1 Tax=Nonomuraea sp. PA05 TaxID=2604466 RepID=UPI0011DC4858|nr:GNAT family N-acetyltransferase [Nonomuraea sp. PA05]TYB70916.1 GNAT family N-acetyltransferase [Nonomuraea sp. PA05]
MDELARWPALDRGGAAADLARALAFLHGFARRRAPVVVPVPGGFGVLDDRFPGSYDDNKLIITTDGNALGEGTAGEGPGGAATGTGPGGAAVGGSPGGAAGEGLAGEGLAGAMPAGEEQAWRLMAAADEVLAERRHRLVCVDDDRLGTACAPAFAAAGYEHETNLVMVFRGQLPHDPPPAERLDTAELEPVLRRDWRRTLPQAPEEVIDGLARRVEARLRGADTVGFRGVRTPSGEIAARADLYAHGGVAQIESVFTGEEHRGQGYARSLMRSLLAEARDAELIFLLADAGDWPRHFYERLGFTEVGRTHAFLRT